MLTIPKKAMKKLLEEEVDTKELSKEQMSELLKNTGVSTAVVHDPEPFRDE